jgi:hypothetical protein
MRQVDIKQVEYLFAEGILVKRCYTGFMIGEEIAYGDTTGIFLPY